MIFKITRQLLFQKQLIRGRNRLGSFLLVLAIGLLSITANAQVATWTGAVDAAWENPANWSPNNIPLATDEVIIPDASPNMSPTISNQTMVRSLEVQAGGQLTINAGVTLRIDGSPNIGILNDGTIISDGSILLGDASSTNPPLSIGIVNNGSFTITSTGALSAERVGIAGDPNGVVIQNNSQFINEGEIIDFTGATTGLIIDQMGTFTNSGSITFFSTQNAIPLSIQSGTLINQTDASIGFLGGDRIIVETNGIIDNQTCAGFGHSNGIINNGGQITNSGFLLLDFYRLFALPLPLPTVNTGSITNNLDGVITFSSTPTLTNISNPINNTGAILEEFVDVVVPVSCSTPVSYSPFVNFDPGNLVLEFSTDQAGNNIAGTFDNATNTFIPNDPNQTEFFIRVDNPNCSTILLQPIPFSIVLDADSDGDGVLDCDDLCLNTSVEEATNADGCACSQLTVDDNDPCTEDICTAGIISNTFQDADGDLTCDADDACPNDPNKIAPGVCGCDFSDEDLDNDNIVDCNDLCPGTPSGEPTNADGCACSQLTVDDNDPCTEDICTAGIISNTFQDADGDLTCDADDGCPNDPNKIAPGVCGCDFSDEDLDNDNIVDCNDLCPGTPAGELTNADGCACSQLTVDDNDPCTEDICTAGIISNTFQDADGDLTCDADDACPNDPNKIAPGVCGCDFSDEDLDNDNIVDCNDLCPGTPSGEPTNADGCACSQLTVDDNDPCTEDICTAGIISNTFQDADGDLTCDADDGCPNDPNKIAPGVCGCGVEDIDSNGDGIFDCENTSVYCPAMGESTEYEWIEKVRISGIQNQSGDDGGYADFTSTNFSLEKGNNNLITLIPGFSGSNYYEYWTIYIDLNQDGDFFDVGELVYSRVSAYGIADVLSIPTSAMSGSTRMRVMMSYNGWAYPCDTFQNGEVEDYTVTISEPAVSYCSSAGNNSHEEWIKKVTLNGINNFSGDDGGYADYTNHYTQLWQGQTKTITLKPGFSGYAYREYWKVWVDWNQDGDFDDWGELEVAASSFGNLYKQISVPYNAVPGITRMRVSMKYGGWPSSCGNFSYGEVEDYTIIVGTQGFASEPIPNDGELKLTATTKANNVQLDWINDTGDQNDYFVVEKSLDGRNFELLTTVENQKSDRTMRNYTTTDIKAVKGINYYRIKLIMKDGTERYSEIRSAKITQDPNQIAVYPNPTSEEVYINLKAFSGMDAEIMIVNNFGKMVYEESISKIQKTTHRIDLDRLQAGHYTISILVEGRKRIAKPLVIVRM